MIAKENEVIGLKREADMLKMAQIQKEEQIKHLSQVATAPKNTPLIRKMPHEEEETEFAIVKRKSESLRKENELLRKQCFEFRQRIESLQQQQMSSASRNVPISANSSGHFNDSDRPGRNTPSRKEQLLQNDLSLKDLEVAYSF